MRRSLRVTLALWRRELLALFVAPVVWLLFALFLVVEGYSFWFFLRLVAGGASQHGAVLQYFFGGTFLFWLFIMFLGAALTMRLVADEERLGTWEPLLTAPVHEIEVVAAKYLAALVMYLVLWAPTLLYVLVFVSLLAPGQRLDLGPVAAAYLGVATIGASALAIGVLGSSLGRSQLLAAGFSFTVLTLMLVSGALGDTVLVGSEGVGAVLRRMNLFRMMDDFARGIVDSRHLVFHCALALLAVFIAARVWRWRRRRGGGRRMLLESALLGFIIVSANHFAARHFARWDWTSAHQFTLAPATRDILMRLQQPVEVTMLMRPSGQAASDLYGNVRELLERAAAVTPRLHVAILDLDRDRERLAEAARRYHIGDDDLRDGVVVVTRAAGARELSKFLRADELAEYESVPFDEPRAPRLLAWKGEEALAAALLAVSEDAPARLCFSTGHGEPAIDSLQAGEYGALAEALRRDHLAVETVDLVTTRVVPRTCNLVVVAGPRQPFSPEEAAPLGVWLDGGGRLLALIGPTLDSEGESFAQTGLEPLLERHGVTARAAVVVDEPRLPTSILAFAVSDGFADHPAVRGLHGKRTLWTDVRPLAPAAVAGVDSRVIISTSAAGWGETNLDVWKLRAELHFDERRDLRGPLAIGVAAQSAGGGARVVALGSHALFGNRQMVAYNHALLAAVVGWLLDRPARVVVAAKHPEELQLALGEAQLARAFWLCVVALPLLVLLLGIGVRWARRA